MRQLFRELKRRHVFRVAAVYAVVAWVVIQVANVVFPRLDLPGWTVTFVIVLVGLSFPLALVLAWAFEMTPEGVRRTAGARDDAVEPSTTAAAGWIAALVLLLAAGAAAWHMTGGRGEPASEPGAAATGSVRDGSAIGRRSIAVLPFEPLSADEESRTFARGIHDDLLTRLAHVSELTVISRTAVQQYQDTDLTTGQIADSLGVRWVMEGGVQVLGERIQVNAQLIDPRTEAHAWADSYQRDLTTEDLFALQGQITKRIAASLQAELTPEETERVERQPTQDLEAYRLYVQGRQLLGKRTGPSIREAIGYFQRAIEQDSSYALAWSGLADARGLYPVHGEGYRGGSDRAHEREHEAAAGRALELGSDLAEAHASMGFFHFHQQNGVAALRELRRAVELKPSYFQAHHWLAFVLLNLGRLEGAQRHGTLAVQLNPRQPAAHDVRVATLVASGQAEEARPHLQVMGDTEPLYRALYLYHTRRWKALKTLAEQYIQKGEARPPIWRFYLARVALLNGDTTAARAHLAQIGGLGDHFEEGLVHAALGESDDAFRAWEKIVKWLSPGNPSLSVLYRPWYADVLERLRGDARFQRLVRRRIQAWGLNPDGSLPDSLDVTFGSEADG